MTQVAMPPALLARMAREIEHVEVRQGRGAAHRSQGFRPCSPSAIHRFRGLNGQFLIEEVERGARGVMPGSDMSGVCRDMESARRRRSCRGLAHLHARFAADTFELQPGMGVSAMKHTWWRRESSALRGCVIPPPSLDHAA